MPQAFIDVTMPAVDASIEEMSTRQTTATSAVPSGDTSFFGHPKMLASLFSVEMWERFSFYGMQGILLYYMYFTAEPRRPRPSTNRLAAGLVGAYGGGVYLSTILGAWLADRLFGSERVLFGSAIMIMGGHIALALLPGIPGLVAGLVLVGIGSGGLKANATALVGTLYGEKDERRDAGFSIFYMGINIGGLIGPLVTGWLQASNGFHWASAPRPWAWRSAWSSTRWAASGSLKKPTASPTPFPPLSGADTG